MLRQSRSASKILCENLQFTDVAEKKAEPSHNIDDSGACDIVVNDTKIEYQMFNPNIRYAFQNHHLVKLDMDLNMGKGTWLVGTP